MKYVVVESYESQYKNPINVAKNERVNIEIEYDEEYPNWFFCKKLDNSNSGWIPEKIIRKENNFGIITENYSAKELDVKKDYIIKGFKELEGWIWCECENTKEIGWVPIKNIKKVD
jgi:hypothetical protein